MLRYLCIDDEFNGGDGIREAILTATIASANVKRIIRGIHENLVQLNRQLLREMVSQKVSAYHIAGALTELG